jgi:hypothetical protein
MHKYDPKKHDAFLESVSVPWIMRKTYTSLLSYKKIKALVTFEKGVKIPRPYSLGMAGSKTDFFTIGGDWIRHPNRPHSQNVRCKGEVSKDGRKA